MRKLRFVLRFSMICLAALGSGLACGQDYPNKPVRLVVSAAGGGTDTVARILAPALTNKLGQGAIVDNRGGASGVIPITTVAAAPPDGYWLLLYTNTMWLSPLLHDDIGYDPVKDFEPVSTVGMSPLVVAVNPSVPAKSIEELIALAKAKPGVINYASSGSGSSTHLATELFKSMAGVNLTQVNYKGGGPAMTDLLGNQVQVMFVPGPIVGPLIKSGKLRALAVTSAEPSALAPGLPSIASVGLPGYESVLLFGMLAPAKTPASVINRLNQNLRAVLDTGEVKEKLLASGTEARASSPEQFATAIKSEMARMGKVIKDAGIRAE